MYLVAVLSEDPALCEALGSFRDPEGRYLLHPVPNRHTNDVLASLTVLDFAGALIFGERLQHDVVPSTQRHSLEAQSIGAADTVTVTPGGLIAEYNLGRAVGALLRSVGWDGREAKAVLVGGGPSSKGTARELASLGVARLTVLAENRPAAEEVTSKLAASTEVISRAALDPLGVRFLEEADLVIRTDPGLELPARVLGPHLTLIDMAPTEVSPLRQHALSVGSLSFNLRDVQAHLIALGLSHILGGSILAGAFLNRLHEA